MKRFYLPLAVVSTACVMAACSSDSSTDPGTTESDFTSNQATLMTFDFDGEAVTFSSVNATALVRDQINYSIGQLNAHNAVGQLQKLALTNVSTASQSDGSKLVTYHATLPVSWGSKKTLPNSFEFILPRRVDATGRKQFVEKYGNVGCTQHAADESDMWYYYRPEQTSCKLEPTDVVRLKATVQVAEGQNTTGKYPEYHRVWEDNTLSVVAIFGKATEGATANSDAGINAYNLFVGAMRELVPNTRTTPESVPEQPGLDIPDVTIEADLADGVRRLKVVALLVDKMATVGPSFDARYNPLSRQADVIFYNGHAGLGANVRTIARKGSFERGKYLIFYANGCDTFAYIDFALMAARQGLNADDPEGTKYLDLITNSMPAYFTSLPNSTTVIVKSLLNYEKPKTYEEIFKEFETTAPVDGTADLNKAGIIVVTGEQDNVFVPGYVGAQDPCAAANSGDGAYCGANLNLAGDETLYQCWKKHLVMKTACPVGCTLAPSGKADSCAAEPTPADPCENALYGNGPYCGGTIGGDPSKLYDCQNKATNESNSKPCPTGCAVAPPGDPDDCNP